MAEFDVNAARQAGYSDDEILSHLTETRKFDVQGAVKAGYSKPDIISHLASSPAPAAKSQEQSDHSMLDSIAEFGKGLVWDTAKGLYAAGKRIALPPEDMRGKVARLVGGPLGPLISDIVKSHVDTGKKAVEAVQQGRPSEAVGYGAATLLPVVGPAAAGVGETIGGAPAQHDKFGNETAPEQKPQIARGLGQATALIGQTAGLPAYMKSKSAAKASAPAAAGRSGPLVPSGLNPVESDAVDFLRQNDVPLNAGTVTGNRFVKAAQAIAQNQPLGASTAMRATRATEEGLSRVSGELADQAHPAPVSPESAGQAVPAALQKKIGDIGLAENAGYEKAWAARNDPAHTYTLPIKTVGSGDKVMKQVNMPVDVTDIKYAAKPIFDEMQWMPAADRASSAGYQALKNILEGDDYIPAWQAERGLSGLKTMARVENKSGVRNTSQGIGASLIPELQANIDASVANTGPEAIKGLQQGRALHASKMEIADLAEQLRDEPVQNFQKLTWKNDTGIDFLRKIGQQVPQVLPQVGRAFIQQLFDQATQEGGFRKSGTLLSKWEALGPETKKMLYQDPALRSNLDKFFKGAQMVAENPNPSGTAVVGSLIPGGMLMVQNPISGGAWLLGGYAASKLLFSPRGVALLTQGMKSTGAGQAALTSAQILALAGKDAKPVSDAELKKLIGKPQQ